MGSFIKALGKVLSYIIIIGIWSGFGYFYFSLYETNLPAEEGQENGEEQGGVPQGIVAQVAESGRSIPPNMLCLNTSALFDLPWGTPLMQEGIQRLTVSTVRIPGGDPAAYWNWQTGEVARDESRIETINRENNLERYVEGLEATGTTPIIVLNMLTADLQDQLTMLQTFEESGIPVQYIELGHGLYQRGLQSNYGQAFPTGNDYSAVAEEWVTAIRSQFPEAALSLVAAPEGVERGGRIDGWNESVFELAESQNLAVSLYPFPQQILEPGQRFDESLVAPVFGLPFQTWGRYSVQEQAPLASLPEGVPVWLTEYNIPVEPEGEFQVAERYGQVLFVLTQSLVFLGDERVEFICPHQLLGPRLWSSFLNRNQRLDLLPTGRAVRILGQAMTGMTTARRIEFTDMPRPDGPNLNYPTLLGWHFEDENGRQTALILNLTPARIEINVASLPEGFPQRYQQTLGVPTRRMRNNQGAEVVSDDMTGKDYLILLPYSATSFAETFSEE